ncbi:MAG: ABC transporter permease [Thiolinea sp.]
MWSMIVRGVQGGLSRTSLAIIALTVAVAATVGVSLMNSFRSSVADWLAMTLSSDLYVSASVKIWRTVTGCCMRNGYRACVPALRKWPRSVPDGPAPESQRHYDRCPGAGTGRTQRVDGFGDIWAVMPGKSGRYLAGKAS